MLGRATLLVPRLMSWQHKGRAVRCWGYSYGGVAVIPLLKPFIWRVDAVCGWGNECSQFETCAD
jgi:hypothetical protein